MYKGVVTTEQIPTLEQLVMLRREKESRIASGTDPALAGLEALAETMAAFGDKFNVLPPLLPLPLLYAAYCQAAMDRGDYRGLEILSEWGERNHQWLGLEDAGA